jgi:metal-dependent amidase/aminoacylase/carboxypeptidase family protein
VTAKDQARSRIAAAADQLLELSHRIHAHPETAWQEHQAASAEQNQKATNICWTGT